MQIKVEINPRLKTNIFSIINIKIAQMKKYKKNSNVNL